MKFPKKMRPLLLGVTVLTSLDSKSIKQLGWKSDVKKKCNKLCSDMQTGWA